MLEEELSTEGPIHTCLYNSESLALMVLFNKSNPFKHYSHIDVNLNILFDLSNTQTCTFSFMTLITTGASYWH